MKECGQQMKRYSAFWPSLDKLSAGFRQHRAYYNNI